MGDPPVWGRYFELRPADLAAICDKVPVAYLPWGALEWHGPHLPLGLDGVVAEAVASRAIRRTGGVLLPTTWWPAGALPHPSSLSAAGASLGDLLDGLFAQLAAAGWRVAVIVSGHHGHAHELAMIDAAERAISRHGLLALAVPPLALVDETMLDHAALWETSLAMALRPDLVRLDALGREPLRIETSAVIGRDPRDTASASIGVSALNLAAERLAAAVIELRETDNMAPLRALYAQRRARYESFVERFGSDGERATRAWWDDLTQEKPAGG
ncbi:creatininase family protein [Oscillochloris sp. ZM17-4]|uniref:creatininase family protein n=1 Tax=Oscillochloris sp. ZM17-4 TaxID=2866714 RepID=UPI001C72B237|nr:creatininase family protein [Oscillochloris sp. ZM17-4]MBX0326999.1 creatininase family protein [Oscillochloris sp. ZM17-4]